MIDTATPDLATAVGEAIRSFLSEINTAEPGVIVSYDAVKQTASVQPSLKIGFTVDGIRQVRSKPIVNHVPLMFVGSGGRQIKVNVNPGDQVLLIFCHSSIDIWKSKGGEVDPGDDDRKHHLSDAIAIVGLQNKAVDTAPIIEFTDTQIRVGGNSPLATKADIDALRTWVAAQFSGVGHIHATPSGNTTGTTPVAAPGSSPPNAAGTSILVGS